VAVSLVCLPGPSVARMTRQCRKLRQVSGCWRVSCPCVHQRAPLVEEIGSQTSSCRAVADRMCERSYGKPPARSSRTVRSLADSAGWVQLPSVVRGHNAGGRRNYCSHCYLIVGLMAQHTGGRNSSAFAGARISDSRAAPLLVIWNEKKSWVEFSRTNFGFR
jgi:hypothetical protein